MTDPKVPAKVMLVDDDWMNRDLMGILLQRAGFQLVAVNSGEEALESAVREQPALILCDVMMEGISGYEVCRQIKAHPQTTHIPVAILTSFENDEERGKAKAAGADEFITKLLPPEKLLARIRSLVS